MSGAPGVVSLDERIAYRLEREAKLRAFADNAVKLGHVALAITYQRQADRHARWIRAHAPTLTTDTTED